MIYVSAISFFLSVCCALRGSPWAYFWLVPFLVWA